MFRILLYRRGKQWAPRLSLFPQPIRTEEAFTFNFNKMLPVPLYSFVGGIRAGEREQGNLSLHSDGCIQARGMEQLAFRSFLKALYGPTAPS